VSACEEIVASGPGFAARQRTWTEQYGGKPQAQRRDAPQIYSQALSTAARAARLRAGFGLGIRPALFAGNRVRLLVNGEQYFPALLAAIEASRRSVYLETYIFADDSIGQRVADALEAAAARGVQVHVTIDGFGGGEAGRRIVESLRIHGAQAMIYRPERWWRLQRRLLRRLHRKIAVVDDRLAFVGGINIIDDYADVPPAQGGRRAPRFDFAVACEGPIVAEIALAARRLGWLLALRQWRAGTRLPARPAPVARARPFADGVSVSLLLRDNLRHRGTIERAYLEAIGGARGEVLIACAYFLPGRTFRGALRAAAARGVRVRLLLQGRVEYALQHHAQQALYGQLLEAGVEIHEYTLSYLHAKVAVVDQRWSTVGSSNIDPYSLLLAREANVVVHDARFAGELRAVLERAIAEGSYPLRREDYARRPWWVRLLNWSAYGLLRLATVVLARARDY
jgi:cardiolipin synthase